MERKRLLILLEGVIMAALAMALSFVPNPPNIDIALGILPIVVYSLRRGLKMGLIIGLLYGTLPILIGTAYVLTPVQAILEYPVANFVLGFAGLFSTRFLGQLRAKNMRGALQALTCAILLAVFLKYFAHFVAGIIFWSKYVQWGLSPVVYSVVINGGSMIVNMIIAMLILSVMLKKSPGIFLDK
ncbi:energy-coupled thiamine transporter ThiT [Dellaglioa sp. BT-FLS60]